MGTFVAVFVGMVVSFMTRPNDPRDIDPKLLAPFVKKLIKPREYLNERAGDEIIYAYVPTRVRPFTVNYFYLEYNKSFNDMF